MSEEAKNNPAPSTQMTGYEEAIEQAARIAERYDETNTLSAPKAIASAIRALRTTQPMTLKHPEYAHGISDAELIKEAIEFCNEELDGYEGMEYDDDCEVACQRSNTFIRELVRRLKAETPAYWVRHRVSDGRATFWETEVPDSYPLYRRTPSPETNVLAQGEIEIVEYGTKGTRGMTRITPDDWWFKLPTGHYKIIAVPLDVPSPQTREVGE